MSEVIAALVEVVTTLTSIDADTATVELRAGRAGEEHDLATSTLTNLVRQAPATATDRSRLLDLVSGAAGTASTAPLLAAAQILRTNPPRFPDRTGETVLPALDPLLTETFAVLQSLDVIAAPWTIVGALMVLLHCAEHSVPFRRATADADLAVGVFTHRRALGDLTRHLRDIGFTDTTPAPLAGGRLSYRWSREKVAIDLLVPERVNDQQSVPVTATRLPAVELPGTQQALARSERLAIRLADGRSGTVRRPDLLGALTIKAAAATTDRRDPGRHLGDLVALLDALAASGEVVRYADEARPKDRARLTSGTSLLTDAHWRAALDPPAARDALGILLGADA